jgi:hypothetical protein
MRRYLWTVALAGAVALGACAQAAPEPEPEAATPETAQPGAMFEPLVTLNQVMVDVINENAHVVWDIDIPGNELETDEDWAAVRRAAATLTAAGSITVMGGSGPDDQLWVDRPAWQQMSQDLAQAGMLAMAAVEDRNVGAVRRAGNDLVNACINCHRSYRLDEPEIWAEVDQRVPEQ